MLFPSEGFWLSPFTVWRLLTSHCRLDIRSLEDRSPFWGYEIFYSACLPIWCHQNGFIIRCPCCKYPYDCKRIRQMLALRQAFERWRLYVQFLEGLSRFLEANCSFYTTHTHHFSLTDAQIRWLLRAKELECNKLRIQACPQTPAWTYMAESFLNYRQRLTLPYHNNHTGILAQTC